MSDIQRFIEQLAEEHGADAVVNSILGAIEQLAERPNEPAGKDADSQRVALYEHARVQSERCSICSRTFPVADLNPVHRTGLSKSAPMPDKPYGYFCEDCDTHIGKAMTYLSELREYNKDGDTKACVLDLLWLAQDIYRTDNGYRSTIMAERERYEEAYKAYTEAHLHITRLEERIRALLSKQAEHESFKRDITKYLRKHGLIVNTGVQNHDAD